MKLAQVRKIALKLPEVTEEPHFERTSFRIRGKVIATAIEGEPFLNVMASEATREPALAMNPDALEKLFWGAKVCGVTVNLDVADAELVGDLLEKTWRDKAPKSLLKN